MQVFADPITVNCRKVLAGLKMLGVDYTLSKSMISKVSIRARSSRR